MTTAADCSLLQWIRVLAVYNAFVEYVQVTTNNIDNTESVKTGSHSAQTAQGHRCQTDTELKIYHFIICLTCEL
jgi:hypothetical protein